MNLSTEAINELVDVAILAELWLLGQKVQDEDYGLGLALQNTVEARMQELGLEIEFCRIIWGE